MQTGIVNRLLMRVQCDQMATLFFTHIFHYYNENLPNSKKCLIESRFKMLPNTQ